MAVEGRDDTADVRPAIELEDLASFGLFSLAAAIERLYPDAPAIGSAEAPAREPMRFRATRTLGFPPEEVSSVQPSQNGRDHLEVFVNLLGLHGPSSPLPPNYTERIIFAEGDSAVGDFLDFFNHRLVSLLVQIWKYNRYYLRYAKGASDPISSIVGALFGLLPGRQGAEDEEWRVRLLPHVGVLSLASRSARMVSGIITSHLSVPCTIEEFIPREIDIPADALWLLGEAGGELGMNSVAGETMADVSGQFRVCLGPLNHEQFESLLPGRPAHDVLARLIGLALREPLAWDLRLALAPGAAPEWVLGAGELGWTTMLEPQRDTIVPILL